jgi:lactoylglutathione lyase
MKSPNYKIANGNSDPGRGFGHICISVDNIQAACQRIEDAGYPFQKKLTDGRMRNIAFAKDPDGYWVEIIGQKPLEETKDIKTTEISSYRFNHSMIRVKSAEESLKFYQEVMGMTLLRTSENKDNSFNLYFLGYPGDYDYKNSPNGVNPVAGKEGILELTWNVSADVITATVSDIPFLLYHIKDALFVVSFITVTFLKYPHGLTTNG